MNAKRTTPRQAAARAVEKATGTAPATPASIETLLGSSLQPALIEIGEAKIQLGEIVASAHLASGLTLEAWNALEGEAREKLLQAEIDLRRGEVAAKVPETVNRPEPAPEPAVSPAAPAGPDYLTMPLDELLLATIAQMAVFRGVGREEIVAALRQVLSAEAAPVAALPETVPEGKVRVRVRGPQAGRRRLGRQFAPEAQDIDVTPEELLVLRADSELAVKEIGDQAAG